MWRYGEVLLPLPQTSRRIDVTVGTAPQDEVRYLTTCGGTNYGEGGQKVLVWRTKQHQIELFDFHLRNQELNDAVTINFPRRVQVLPHVSVLETEKRITLVIATQGSFHIIELSDIPGTSIISVRVKNSVFVSEDEL